eukprot:CAMPEP_0172167184 /NCGR_PEP_ID=MMETSP1050-20130122/9427_1 /TAXON_ID=233186 /ORGANISM="Cryptomonas curvata, Strain CCAP979/52" /LENGTH=413 /DNA_ID=CAMNT_0012837939 /DNA_START=127 /DNA_END=1368 /DNA_ORIENTATION=-
MIDCVIAPLMRARAHLALAADDADAGPGLALAAQDELGQVLRGGVGDDARVAADGERGHDGDVADVLLVEDEREQLRRQAQRDGLLAPVHHLGAHHVAHRRRQPPHHPLPRPTRLAADGVALGALDEGDGVGVGLADDEVVDVEELLQPVHRQVRLQAAVGPLDVAHVVRHLHPPRVLREQLHRLVEPGQRARGGRGAPHEHVGRREVVEQPRLLVVVAGRHRDVDDAAGALVGLVEGHVPHVVDECSLQLLDVHEVARLEDPAQLALQAPNGVEEFEADGAADGLDVPREEQLQLLAGAHGDDARHDGPRRAAGDDAGEQLVLEEGLEDPEVVHAERGPPGQQQRRLAQRVPRLREEGELLLEGELAVAAVAHPQQHPDQLALVLLDEELGADVGVVVEHVVADAAEVALQA